MVAVSLDAQAAKDFIESQEYSGTVCIQVVQKTSILWLLTIVGIAAVNSPTSVTLSGDAIQIDKIADQMKERGVMAQV